MLALLLPPLISPTEACAQEFLRASGQRIVDASGEEVILRGMGLGGWMLQEGYMLRTAGPQHRIEARIEELVGRERKDAFYDAWLANHTRRIDVDSMAAWGFNSIRLPMHYKWFTPPIEEEPVPGEITWREDGFRLIDQLLDWAGANRMYLFLDLHAAPGGQGKNADINDYDPGKPSLWESAANQEKTIALWRRLAERYRDEPWMGGYDLINEPNWGFEDLAEDPNGCAEAGNAPLWELQRRITAAIREVDRNHLIVLEGNCWGNNYRGLPELWDDNLVVSFHKYWNYNDVASIRHMLDMRATRDVPVWLGESGENSNTWFTNAIALLEAHGIGWAWWPLKKIGVNNPLEIVSPPAYERLRAFWRDEAPRPAGDEAWRALMELTESLKLEHNIIHRDVVDAMIRQPHTTEVLPFTAHRITPGATATIAAVDYDLGRQGHAYSDADTANYHVSTGAARTPWNHGGAYRNDGVDIGTDPDDPEGGHYVGWTETGEWLQYTTEVTDGGLYTVHVEHAAADDGGALSLRVDGETVTERIPLPETGGVHQWIVRPVATVRLPSGRRRLRVVVEKGGFNLKSLRFSGPDD
ncbi:MAG: cellulase family glycosylhydrolase [Gemmatimonadetes bacterium]|nr:cellulase family glycosylhydrolase [Gemmatimonadota bacterium]